MPRQPRLDAPDTLHHVMVRGLEWRAIFRDDADRADFVARLAALAEQGAWSVVAWALLLRDVVDSVDSRLLRPRDRLRDPRRGDLDLARRLGEVQAELRHLFKGEGRERPASGSAVRPKLTAIRCYALNGLIRTAYR